MVPAAPSRPVVAELRVRRASSALWRSGRFGVVVLGADADLPVTLAGTGARLWSVLAEARPVGAIAAELAAMHRADPAVVLGDIAPVVELLLAMGACEVVS